MVFEIDVPLKRQRGDNKDWGDDYFIRTADIINLVIIWPRVEQGRIHEAVGRWRSRGRTNRREFRKHCFEWLRRTTPHSRWKKLPWSQQGSGLENVSRPQQGTPQAHLRGSWIRGLLIKRTTVVSSDFSQGNAWVLNRTLFSSEGSIYACDGVADTPSSFGSLFFYSFKDSKLKIAFMFLFLFLFIEYCIYIHKYMQIPLYHPKSPFLNHLKNQTTADKNKNKPLGSNQPLTTSSHSFFQWFFVR